jgi:hypothetical protein
MPFSVKGVGFFWKNFQVSYKYWIVYSVFMAKKKGCRPGFKKIGASCKLNGWIDKGKMVFQKGAKKLKIEKVPGTKKNFRLVLGNKKLGTKPNLGAATKAAYKYIKAH